jgi:CheY-like chemotaxis protein
MSRDRSNPAKFPGTILPIMLDEMRELGASRRRVGAKIAGGASMFANLITSNAINVGERNVAAVRAALANVKVPIVGEDVGSDHGRSVYLFIEDGRVEVRSLRKGSCPLTRASESADRRRQRVHAPVGVADHRGLGRVLGVVGTARNGMTRSSRFMLDPDLVTLDVDMPELDGLNALGYIMSEMPRPVVMLSAGTTSTGHAATLRALDWARSISSASRRAPSVSDLRVITAQLTRLRAAMQTNVAAQRMLPRVTVDSGGTSAELHDGDERRRHCVIDWRTPRTHRRAPAVAAHARGGGARRPTHARRVHEEPRSAARCYQPIADRRGRRR